MEMPAERKRGWLLGSKQQTRSLFCLSASWLQWWRRVWWSEPHGLHGATICFPVITIFKHRCLWCWSPWFAVLWIIVLTYRDWCSSVWNLLEGHRGVPWPLFQPRCPHSSCPWPYLSEHCISWLLKWSVLWEGQERTQFRCLFPVAGF